MSFLFREQSQYQLNSQRRPQVLIRMSKNRSLGRDVHIYGAKDTNTVLGGLIASNGVTNANQLLRWHPR